LRKEIKLLKSEIEQLKIQVFDRGESYSTAMEEIEELKNERYRKQYAMRVEVEKAYEIVIKERDEARAEVERLHSRIGELKSTGEGLIKTNSRYLDIISERETEIAALKLQLSKAESSCDRDAKWWQGEHAKVVKELENVKLHISGRTYCHSDEAVEKRCQELEAELSDRLSKQSARDLSCYTEGKISGRREGVESVNTLPHRAMFDSGVAKGRIEGMEEAAKIADKAKSGLVEMDGGVVGVGTVAMAIRKAAQGWKQ
jgi:chromosome segregation ATPase